MSSVQGLRFTWVLLSGILLAACNPAPPASNSTSAPAATEESAARAPAPASDPDPADVSEARAVVGETLPYAEVSEELVYGHFAFPADMVDPLPGIIVIHERWGLDDRTRAFADRLAGLGYIVLAVDLFGGNTADNVGDAGGLMVDVVENPEKANENIRQAYQFLAESAQAPRIGAVGWSFGGNWALNTAYLFPDDLDAVVIYYGQVTDNEERLAPVNAPILGLFAELDKAVTPETVEGFRLALQNLGKNFTIEVFPRTNHAFADPTAVNYFPEQAERAWALVVSFLDQHLSAPAE